MESSRSNAIIRLLLVAALVAAGGLYSRLHTSEATNAALIEKASAILSSDQLASLKTALATGEEKARLAIEASSRR